MGRKRRLSERELSLICEIRGISTEGFNKSKGRNTYNVRLNEYEWDTVTRDRSNIVIDDREVEPQLSNDDGEVARLRSILNIRESTSDIAIEELSPIIDKSGTDSVSVSLLSDIHSDEVVKKESVMGLNEFNEDIAKERIFKYFIEVVKIVSHQQSHYNIKRHILAILGDLIGGYIHEELRQTNSKTPLRAISDLKGWLLSGLKYLNDNLNVSQIDVICVIGNHGRSTDKLQHANMIDTSYEYFLYKDLEVMASSMGLNKLRFIIPECPMVIQPIFDKRVLITHGNLGFRYAGGIGGLTVPFLRWYGKMSPVLKFDYVLFGHYHQSMLLKEGCCNGSVKGYDAYSFNKGLSYEPPCQALLIFNSARGVNMFHPIFL